MALDPTDDPLGRILGTSPDPRDALAAHEALTIGSALRQVPLPTPQLPGWQSLCATEYAEALRALVHEIGVAGSALAAAAAAVR